jgi:hypothetical protein
MTSLLDNLSIAWTGDFDSLRKFTSNELKLDGNWEQPGGDKKYLTVKISLLHSGRPKAYSISKV